MGGVETSRGIAYQNAQAVLAALSVLQDDALGGVRIEGTDDILDIEVHRSTGELAAGMQIKTRVPSNPWGKAPIVSALNRWLDLNVDDAKFEFVTDGVLGPSATSLSDALDCARDGDFGPLAVFLGTDAADSRLPRLAQARVRQDVTGAEAVLAIAEREVSTLLAGGRTEHDLHAAAKSAVDALLRELASRAGSSDEAERFLTAEHISEILGGIRGIPTSDRWPAVGAEYRAAATARTSHLVEPTLHEDPAPAHPPEFAVEELLNNETAVLVSGRTGCGKSSAAEIAVQRGCTEGRTVIRAHAEAYVTGHLAAFVADAVSEMMQRQVPTITGHQILGDHEVTLLIDGASEIPLPMRQDLREELRPILTGTTTARIVLIGRDRAALGSLLPTSIEPRRFTLALFDHHQRAAIVREDDGVQALLKGRPTEEEDRVVRDLVHAVERPLGDAAGNPMLFALGLQAAVAGEDFNTDSALYATTIARVAERAHMSDIDLTCAALGIVFASLLDAGRRFVYPNEYRRLLSGAADQLASEYFDVGLEVLHSNIDRSGLLVPLGARQLLVPVHDSYADYFAAIAHAQGLVSLPERLTSSDERRVEFTAELGGLNGPLIERIARDLPFRTVSLARHDPRRLTGADALAQVGALTSLLLATEDNDSPVLSRVGDQVLAALVPGAEPSWLETEQFADVAASFPRIVLNVKDSPLSAAVRLWRVFLQVRLGQSTGLSVRHPQSLEDAAELLRDHLEQEREVLRDLISAISPAGHLDTLKAALGPLGFNATIGVESDSSRFSDFWVVYEHTDSINVMVSDADRDTLIAQMRAMSGRSGSAGIESFLRVTPAAGAVLRVKKALESLIEGAWLQ